MISCGGIGEDRIFGVGSVVGWVVLDKNKAWEMVYFGGNECETGIERN